MEEPCRGLRVGELDLDQHLDSPLLDYDGIDLAALLVAKVTKLVPVTVAVLEKLNPLQEMVCDEVLEPGALVTDDISVVEEVDLGGLPDGAWKAANERADRED